MDLDDLGPYVPIAFIVGGLAFLGTWIYAIVTYGFFFGVGLGWIPALGIGVVAGALWPLIALAILGIIVLFFYRYYLI